MLTHCTNIGITSECINNYINEFIEKNVLSLGKNEFKKIKHLIKILIYNKNNNNHIIIRNIGELNKNPKYITLVLSTSIEEWYQNFNNLTENDIIDFLLYIEKYIDGPKDSDYYRSIYSNLEKYSTVKFENLSISIKCHMMFINFLFYKGNLYFRGKFQIYNIGNTIGAVIYNKIMDRYYWAIKRTDIIFNPIDNYNKKYKEFTDKLCLLTNIDEICQIINSYDDTFFLQIASSAIENI